MDLINFSNDKFNDWLNSHKLIAKHIKIEYLKNKENNQMKYLEIKERLTKFFYDKLLPNSPHEPILPKIPKGIISLKTSNFIRKLFFLIKKRHKIRIKNFNNSIRVFSELITLFSTLEIIPKNLFIEINEQSLFNDLFIEDNLSQKFQFYIKEFESIANSISIQEQDIYNPKDALFSIINYSKEKIINNSFYFTFNTTQDLFNIIIL